MDVTTEGQQNLLLQLTRQNAVCVYPSEGSILYAALQESAQATLEYLKPGMHLQYNLCRISNEFWMPHTHVCHIAVCPLHN